mmetsp:Transcript_426/g.1461  ORF Transcript_426/g.1461 Transcript_426/m.1461 type:complete len:210 (+) Transcript_426:770-1399(+)
MRFSTPLRRPSRTTAFRCSWSTSLRECRACCPTYCSTRFSTAWPQWNLPIPVPHSRPCGVGSEIQTAFGDLSFHQKSEQRPLRDAQSPYLHISRVDARKPQWPGGIVYRYRDDVTRGPQPCSQPHRHCRPRVSLLLAKRWYATTLCPGDYGFNAADDLNSPCRFISTALDLSPCNCLLVSKLLWVQRLGQALHRQLQDLHVLPLCHLFR